MGRPPIGPYRIVRELGHGGMGKVYEAVEDRLRRRVAIKVLSPQHAGKADLIARFHSEALAANAIEHSGVVKIHEFGQLDDGSAYLVMEYLKGETLAERLKKKPGQMSEAEALPIARQLASALEAAHDQGIVHRDLKPANVMIVPEAVLGERIKLLDFGIAKFAEGVGDVNKPPTQTNMILGTPHYMSPEQCRSLKDIDGKADVYALGVLLYRLLAGRLPFAGADNFELLTKHVTEPPPPLRANAPTVSEPLVALVHRMLEKDRARRPSMTEVLAELEALHTRSSIPPPGAPTPLGVTVPLSVVSSLAPIHYRRPATDTAPMAEVAVAVPLAARPTSLLGRLTAPLSLIKAEQNVPSHAAAPDGTGGMAASPSQFSAVAPDISTLTFQRRRAWIWGGVLVGLTLVGTAGYWQYAHRKQPTAQSPPARGNTSLNAPAVLATSTVTPSATMKATNGQPPTTPVAPDAAAPARTATDSESKEKAPSAAPVPGPPREVSPAPPVLAQKPPGDSICELDKKNGQEFKKQKQWQEALAAFTAAYDRCGKADLLAEIGRAHEELQAYHLAIPLYQRLLTEELGQSQEYKGIASKRLNEACEKAAAFYAQRDSTTSTENYSLNTLNSVRVIGLACPEASIQLKWAKLLFVSGDYKEVMTKCDEILRIATTEDLKAEARQLKKDAQSKATPMSADGIRNPFGP